MGLASSISKSVEWSSLWLWTEVWILWFWCISRSTNVWLWVILCLWELLAATTKHGCSLHIIRLASLFVFCMFCRILHKYSLKQDLRCYLLCMLFMTLKIYISWVMMVVRFHILCIIIIFLSWCGEWFYFYTLDNILNFRLLWNLC